MKLTDLHAAGMTPVWDGRGPLRPLDRYTEQGRSAGTMPDTPYLRRTREQEARIVPLGRES